MYHCTSPESKPELKISDAEHLLTDYVLTSQQEGPHEISHLSQPLVTGASSRQAFHFLC